MACNLALESWSSRSRLPEQDIRPPRHWSKLRPSCPLLRQRTQEAKQIRRETSVLLAELLELTDQSRNGNDIYLPVLPHPPARTQVVIRLPRLFGGDHRQLPLDRLALEIHRRKLPDVLLRQVVLGPALLEAAAGVEQDDLTLARGGLALGEHDDDAGGGGVVEEVLRQQDHAVDQVAVDEPLADVAFLVLVLRAGADRKSTRLNSSHVKTSYAV